MHKLNIGYGTNGSLVDKKILADGSVAVDRDAVAIQLEPLLRCLQQEHNVFRLVKDTVDQYSIAKFGKDAFSFNQDVRYETYKKWQYMPPEEFKNLDLVVWEWRWQIPGRNSIADIGKPYFQDDFINQCKFFKLFKQYHIPVIIFDADYKLTDDDVRLTYENLIGILDYGTKWENRSELGITVDSCFDVNYFGMYKPVEPSDTCVYIGNRYERDWCIDKYLCDGTRIYGNWAESKFDSKERWPHLNFGPRVQHYQFKELYSTALAVPLLAKQIYCYYGFMAPRLTEAVFYGTLPLFIEEFTRNHVFCPKKLRKYLYIRDNSYINRIKSISFEDRKDIIYTLRDHLSFIDAAYTAEAILKAYTQSKYY